MRINGNQPEGEDEQEVDTVEDELEEEDEQGDEEAVEDEGQDDTSEEDEQGDQEEGSPEALSEDDTAPVYLPTGEGPATARLREMLDPDVNAAVQAAIHEQVSRAMQTFGVTQAAFGAAAAAHPEVFRKYGGKIQMALAMFPEHERHTRKSVDLAITLATIEDKAGKPEFAKELLKIAQQLNGGRETAPKAPKAPIPALSRPPSPSSGARAQVVSTKEQKIDTLMKSYGLDREEAEGMLYEASRKPTGRR